MPAAKNSIQVGDEFARSGYGVVVIWRENDIVVLRATWKGDRALETSGERPHYQVHVLKKNKSKVLGNRLYPDREGPLPARTRCRRPGRSSTGSGSPC